MNVTDNYNVVLKEHPWTEISNSASSPIRAMAFAANGHYLVSGDKEAVRMWRIADNQQVGGAEMKDVRSVAVSRDGKWIAAGTSWGEMTVWDAKTFKEVFKQDKELDGHTVTSVDFSPDSTRLVTASGNRKAYVWDITTFQQVVRPFEHPYWVTAAKFSPGRGEHIATATFRESVRVYDIRSGSPAVTISEAAVTPYYNTGLLWLNKDLLILSNKSINRINLSTRSVALQWSVASGNYPYIISPESGEFVLYSDGSEITKFNYNSRRGSQNQSTVPLPQDVYSADSIALSPDSRFLAIGGADGKLFVKSLVTTYEKTNTTNVAKRNP